jgi:hypothetical protein
VQKKNIVKYVLDIIMIITSVLLYNSHVLLLNFHEIAGISILGVFIIHCLLNGKWIAAVTGKLFSRTLPAKTVFSYWVTALLAISFLGIVISGVLFSKVLFPGIAEAVGDGPWRIIHVFLSALSLILLGIHLGLYWDFVKKMTKKAIRLPKVVTNVLVYVLLIAVIGYGAYNVVTTNFVAWLASPFTGETGGHGGGGHGHGEATEGTEGEATTETTGHGSEEAAPEEAATGESTGHGSGAAATEESTGHGEATEGTEGEATAETTTETTTGRGGRGEAAENPTAPEETEGEAATETTTGRGGGAATTSVAEGEAAPEEAATGETTGRGGRGEAAETEDSAAPEEAVTGESTGHGSEEPATGEETTEAAEGGEASGERSGGGHGHTIDPLNIPVVMATYGSIIGIFAAITYYLSKLLAKRKKKKEVPSEASAA